jgi:hypothetical protein
VNSRREVKRGTLVSKLALAGDVTSAPDTHVAYFEGDYPCRQDGTALEQIRNQSNRLQLAPDVVVDHTLSARPVPSGRYDNYHAKMTIYIAMISGYARAIDPSVTAQTFPITQSEDENSPFEYLDTASSRAEIVLVTKKLEL